MTGTLQPLDSKFAVVDGQGRPTDYFTRWAQQKQIDIGNSITLTDLQTYLSEHLLKAGQGIALTPDGNINDSPLISVLNGVGLNFDAMHNLKLADTSVVPGTYGDATHVPQLVVDQQGRITGVTLVPITGGGGGGSAPVSPDTYPTTPNAADDEFDFGTTLDLTGARRVGATPWTWITTPPTNAPVIENGAVCIIQNNEAMKAFDQPVSGATFKYRAKLAFAEPMNGTGQMWQGLYFRNSVNGHVLVLDRGYNGNYVIEAVRWNNLNPLSFASAGLTQTYGADNYGFVRGVMYFQVEYDGTTLFLRGCMTGYPHAFVTIYSETAASFLAGPPTHVGLLTFNGTATQQNYGFDFFRKVA